MLTTSLVSNIYWSFFQYLLVQKADKIDEDGDYIAIKVAHPKLFKGDLATTANIIGITNTMDSQGFVDCCSITCGYW